MTKDKALKLALEALTIQLENSNGEHKYADAIAEIKALAQPPLPVQRQPLTDNQIYAAIRPIYGTDEACKAAIKVSLDEFRAIEAAHNIGGATK
tara:strand:+ start:394 stop:675 length:282 start_codon:yes stop_codon:yes gene_type:complete